MREPLPEKGLVGSVPDPSRFLADRVQFIHTLTLPTIPSEGLAIQMEGGVVLMDLGGNVLGSLKGAAVDHLATRSTGPVLIKLESGYISLSKGVARIAPFLDESWLSKGQR